MWGEDGRWDRQTNQRGNIADHFRTVSRYEFPDLLDNKVPMREDGVETDGDTQPYMLYAVKAGI
jgi:hypothetical protein